MRSRPQKIGTIAWMTCAVLCFGCGGKSGGAAVAGAGNDTSSALGPQDAGASLTDASTVLDSAAPIRGADVAASPADSATTPAPDVVAAPDGAGAENLTACHLDEDCVLIEVGCCDHCNGGKLMSVNVKAKPEALAKYKAKDCKGKKCTLMGCMPKVPSCVLAQTAVAGQCAYKTKGAKVVSDCPSLATRALCKGQAGCVESWGWKPADMCNNKAGDKIFAGCVKGGFACTGALSCGVQDGSGQALVFPSGCQPKGWKFKPMATCCP